MNYKLNKSEVLYRGKVFDLQIDEITYDSGNNGIREIAVHAGGAVIVPITNEGKIVLVKQFRYPFQKYMLEMPAGKLNKGEDPYLCAVRELEEETGYKADKVEKLGAIATTPGFCTEILHLYIATGLTPGRHNREEGELTMEVYEYSFEDVERLISEGELYDAKSICAFYMAYNKLRN
ncbi:MAG: ADP-ribose pyrophosphatase [Ignavibacteria bacterium CG2_30_36_16]|nr:NUDIX hydrolase [Ignavibacteria bacterium]OIP56733.1 MAG: ADP-ribose pyrophosphatase [Ignavibacteria bacterium CG2_30_36_16]